MGKRNGTPRWVGFKIETDGRTFHTVMRDDEFIEWARVGNQPVSNEWTLEQCMESEGAIYVSEPETSDNFVGNIYAYVTDWLGMHSDVQIKRQCRRNSIPVGYMYDLASGNSNKPTARVLSMLGLRRSSRSYFRAD